MAFVDQVVPVPRNRILAALPSDELARLWPRLEPFTMTEHHSLRRQGDPMKAAYFPESGWFSILTTFADGSGAEVGIVGREGILGFAIFLGSARAGVEAKVQCPGTALRLDAAAFREVSDQCPTFRKLVLSYVLARHLQSTQLAACNARHQVGQRLALKLLMAHDRGDGDEFPMTHESLAMMLGVRRAGVTVAAGRLQKAGLICYSAGRVAVTDRPGLEAAACECYGVIRDAFDRLIGPAARPGPAYRP